MSPREREQLFEYVAAALLIVLAVVVALSVSSILVAGA